MASPLHGIIAQHVAPKFEDGRMKGSHASPRLAGIHRESEVFPLGSNLRASLQAGSKVKGRLEQNSTRAIELWLADTLLTSAKFMRARAALGFNE
jgi:hypothetical protein